MNEQTRIFIRDNADKDIRTLALSGRKHPEVDLPFALDQIAGRQTARRKLPSWAEHDDMIYPPHLSMEQCSSEETARYKADILLGGGEKFNDNELRELLSSNSSTCQLVNLLTEKNDHELNELHELRDDLLSEGEKFNDNELNELLSNNSSTCQLVYSSTEKNDNDVLLSEGEKFNDNELNEFNELLSNNSSTRQLVYSSTESNNSSTEKNNSFNSFNSLFKKNILSNTSGINDRELLSNNLSTRQLVNSSTESNNLSTESNNSSTESNNSSTRQLVYSSTEILVDLTGGFGVDFSFMSRGFQKAVYVERMQHLCDIARENFRTLGMENAEVVNGDGVEYLKGMERVSVIYLDPARRNEHGGKTYAMSDCTPDVTQIKDLLLEKADRVVVKLSPMLDWRKAVDDLQGAVGEVHIVSVDNECKELLLVMEPAPQGLRVVCANIQNGTTDIFEFGTSNNLSTEKNDNELNELNELLSSNSSTCQLVNLSTDASNLSTEFNDNELNELNELLSSNLSTRQLVNLSTDASNLSTEFNDHELRELHELLSSNLSTRQLVNLSTDASNLSTEKDNSCNSFNSLFKKNILSNTSGINDRELLSNNSSTRQLVNLSTEIKESLSSESAYLFEPNASIMKAGCFSLLEQRFGVKQLAQNSHLFVAEHFVGSFPGRRFRIETVTTMNKKEMKKALSGIDKANITVRNFPMSVDELRKRLKIKEGGSNYIFATTLMDKSHVLLLCSRL